MSPLTDEPRAALLDAWRLMVGRSPSDLGRDIAVLGDIFDPRLDAMQVLQRIHTVPVSAEPPPGLANVQPALIVRVGPRTIVTPDGRLALEDYEARISPPHACVLDAYRDWCQAPLLALADEIAGRGEVTTPLALAFLLVVLACGAVGEANAMDITGATLESMRQALWPPLAALNGRIGSGAGGRAQFDNYPLSKARRRMGGDLRREPERRWPGKVWLEASARDRALHVLAYELTVRRGLALDEAQSAVNHTLSVLAKGRQALSDVGLILIDLDPLRRELKAAFLSVGNPSAPAVE